MKQLVLTRASDTDTGTGTGTDTSTDIATPTDLVTFSRRHHHQYCPRLLGSGVGSGSGSVRIVARFLSVTV